MTNIISEDELYTLSFSETAEGWTSFFSYIPEWMVGMNNYFYTFNKGNLYRHNTNEVRNNFYGVQYTSKVITVINDSQTENKLFKTLEIQGDAPWSASLETDMPNYGFIDSDWFSKKEKVWFAFIRNLSNVPASPEDYPLRSMNGIGRSSAVFHTPTTAEIRFSISPLIDIGSIVSVGDYLYYAVAPYTTPLLVGEITEIKRDYVNGKNYIRVDTTISYATPIIGADPYFMYVKNSVAESHGVLGHYCVIELENDSTEKVELLAVQSEVMKSYP